MKKVNLLRQKLDECGIEDYGYFAGFICLFAIGRSRLHNL